jgi:outer membrane receptor protein involved in Fe transport
MSTVLVDNSGQTEEQLRTNNLRDGETLGKFRPMSGQSPYAINVALSYEDSEKQSSVSLAYNVQGEQLTIIASGRVPDIYTIPFHSLNFNAYKSFGKDYRSRLTFGVNNLLNDDVTLVYRSFQAEDGIFTTYKPGLGISLKYSFTF